MTAIAGLPAESRPPRVRSEFFGTEADCLRRLAADTVQAARNGYVPTAQRWTDEESQRHLEVIYALQPSVAAQYVGASGWVVEQPRRSPAPGWVYAGFWRRLLAYCIDWSLWSIVVVVVAFAVLLPAARSILGPRPDLLFRVDPITRRLQPLTPEAVATIQALIRLVLSFGLFFFVATTGYFILMWWLFGGTAGQRLLGIEVRAESDGDRIGFLRACLRMVGMTISGYALGLGFLWIAADDRKQGWHDKIASTVAVRRVH